MDSVINWGLMSHPMNWLTIMLMVVIAAFAIHQLQQFWNAS